LTSNLLFKDSILSNHPKDAKANKATKRFFMLQIFKGETKDVSL